MRLLKPSRSSPAASTSRSGVPKSPSIEPAIVDHRVRLQPADHRIDRRVHVPVHVHVPPEPGDLAVVRAQLAHLGLQELQILEQVRLILRLGRQFVVPSLIGIVRMVPVRDRVVEAERHAPPMAGIGEEPDGVLAVGRVHRVEPRELRIPEAEPVVVFGGQADIAHARLLHEIEPRVRIEGDRVPPRGQLDVLLARHAASPLLLFVEAVDRVEAPVHEHPEALLKPPVATVAEARCLFEAVASRLARRLRGAERRKGTRGGRRGRAAQQHRPGLQKTPAVHGRAPGIGVGRLSHSGRPVERRMGTS